MKILYPVLTFLCIGWVAFTQTEGSVSDPQEAEFVSSDIPRFWQAFDKIEQGGNPFKEYLKNGSPGLKDFIKHRIESPRNLLKTVQRRKEDYQAIRENSFKMDSCIDQIVSYYTNFEKMYPEAVYPPTYFVIGAFNSGGTSKESGLIIGVETQQSITSIPALVAHELVHYNQNYPWERNNTLLAQSIVEGSAEFVSELFTDSPKNGKNFRYGRSNREALCEEFVKIMDDTKYHGWLYGVKAPEGRPRDLGYWIGYEICQAYYSRSEDKNQALVEILNIRDFDAFLEESGFLEEYLEKPSAQRGD
ncbi:MAG: DUF2268 domain-containing putative Zn-dependent protease [Bacteroidota bacterium]